MNVGIDVLFKNVYGVEPEDEGQLEMFVDGLKERLSYGEKNYVLQTYGINLFTEEEIEKNIKLKMHHPVIMRDVFGEECKDEVYQIYERIKDLEYVSMSYIQREFSVGFNRASRIFNELIKRGYIEAESTKQGSKVIK